MSEKVMLLVDSELTGEQQAECRATASRLAAALGLPVEHVVAHSFDLHCAESVLPVERTGGLPIRQVIPPVMAPSAAPMTSAPFVFREDGRPDWSTMWQSFCDLALYGGPPHRGESEALRAADVVDSGLVNPEWDAITEIRRGIWETTGLFAEAAEPGWIAVTCHSRKMAAWLRACIILENVDARCEDERLLLPASPAFELKDQVKSVITVLAKTNHYWQAHLEDVAAAEGGAG